jgi:acyl transferase domain-containing protein/acyl carrier protein
MTRDWTGSEIAIVGMACRFPGAADPEAFWHNLREGVESITFLADDEIEVSGLEPSAPGSPNYVKAASILEDVDRFDAAFFGITPKEAEVMDPQHRLFLECAWQALERAGYDPETPPGAVGLFAGARTDTYLLNLYSNQRSFESLGAFQIGLGNDLAFLSTRVSHRLDLRGPSCSVHTACSTALVAVHLACQSLLTGDCDMALAGGVAVNVPQRTGYLYQPGGIASPDGHCRSFDAAAAGTIFGSGVGIVVLRRLEDALAAGDPIHALIKGSFINNDGSSKASFTAPSVRGQTEVIAEAIASAEVDPRSISYVEAHGTATELGDAIEIRALRRAFGLDGEAGHRCAIGSVKTNFGHLDAAAGAAGLIKTVLMLEHRQIPPSLHFVSPNPKLELAGGPFYVNAELADWEVGEAPRRAGVSSFGVGGTNAHVVLEEAPEIESSGASRPCTLLTLSARSAAALEQATSDLVAYLEEHPEVPLADVAYTLAVGRKAFDHRRSLACTDREAAVAALEAGDRRVVATDHRELADPPVCFLFPGQGAQYVDMAGELYRTEPTFREDLDRCCDLLEPDLGLDLKSVLYPAAADAETAAELLVRTEVAQAALFAVEYALANLWMRWGVRPSAFVGHSIGEYVAACLAGVFSLEDGLALVAERGRMMRRLPGGAMLAVPLAEAELRPALSADLDLAAVNGPTMCVVSGSAEAVAGFERELAGRRVPSSRLRTSHAFHSELMAPMVDAFTERVARVELRAPEIRYLSNLTGTWITPEQATDPAYWGRQLRGTVRFSDGVGTVLRDGVRVLLEVGPGRALGQLSKRDPALGPEHTILASLGDHRDAGRETEPLLRALGTAWGVGVPVDWRAFYGGERRHRVVLPTYPFERQRYWVDPLPSAAGAGTPTGKRKDVADWFHVPSWKRTMAPCPPTAAQLAARPRRWWVLADDGDLGRVLVARLREGGQDVTVVSAGERFEARAEGAFAVAPDRPEDYDRIFDALPPSEGAPDAIVHLWSLTPRGEARSGEELFPAAQRTGLFSLLALARALRRRHPGAAPALWLVSDRLQGVESGDRPLPEKATLLGAAKVMPQELDGLTCVTVDLAFREEGGEPADRLAGRLLAEIEGPGADAEVAYRGAGRWVRTFEPARLEAEAGERRELREGGVYLITGGLGGVGFLLARYLAEAFRARLVLTGRSELPDRARWDDWQAAHGPDDGLSVKIERVRDLERAGAEVLVLAADVASEEQMRAVLTAADARFGRLDGVLHAAGTTSGESLYRGLVEMGPEEAEQQFRAKVHGVYVLEKLLAGREVDFCLLFSSMAAVLGGIGYAAYCAANLFMDAFAGSRKGDAGTAWISADWDPWPEQTKKYAGVRTSVDRYAMSEAEGREAFRRLVCQAEAGQVLVATGDLGPRYDLWIRRPLTGDDGSGQAAGEARSNQARPEMKTAFVAPRDDLERAIAAIWHEVLGIREVGVDDNFFDLGGHSLLMISVQGKLRVDLDVDLPMVDLFKYPTIASLAESLRPERADEPLFDQIDARARQQAEAINRRRSARGAGNGAAAAKATPGTATADEARAAILEALGEVAGGETFEDLWTTGDGARPLGDEDLETFATELVRQVGPRAESILYYPHPFNRGGFVVVIPDDDVDRLDCLVSSYAGAPPDVMVYCLRRRELAELSYPGLFVPVDLNPKVHLPFWLKHKGTVLHGADLRDEVPDRETDPKLVLEGHLSGCALFLRAVVMERLMEGKHLALVRELDRQMRYLMATALLLHAEWDVDLETLPARFARRFGDGALHDSFARLTSVREEMERTADAESRSLALEAVWWVENFVRQLRSRVR